MTDIRMARGDSDILELRITKEDGSALDPPGLTIFEDARFTAKRRISDPDTDAVIAVSLGQGLEIDSEDDDLFLIEVAAADTDDLPDRISRLVWDVQVTDEIGPHTIASGTLIVVPDVSRSSSS